MFSVAISYVWPNTFDWREFLRVNVLKDDDSSSDDETVASPGISTPGLENYSNDENTAYKSPVKVTTQRPSILSLSPDELERPFDAETLTYLRFWLKIAWGFLVFIMAVTLLLWPLPLYREYIFTKSFFSGWVVMAIFWQFLTLFAVVLYPIYDGRHELEQPVRGIWGSLTRRKKG